MADTKKLDCLQSTHLERCAADSGNRGRRAALQPRSSAQRYLQRMQAWFYRTRTQTH